MNENFQSVVLNNRTELSVIGIKSVDSFDDRLVVATTSDDVMICIEGENLAVVDIDLDKGELSVKGNVLSFAYNENNHESQGFFKKLFLKK